MRNTPEICVHSWIWNYAASTRGTLVFRFDKTGSKTNVEVHFIYPTCWSIKARVGHPGKAIEQGTLWKNATDTSPKHMNLHWQLIEADFSVTPDYRLCFSSVDLSGLWRPAGRSALWRITAWKGPRTLASFLTDGCRDVKRISTNTMQRFSETTHQPYL